MPGTTVVEGLKGLNMFVRLLLVEDHAVLAEATAEFLRRAGIEVQVAKSGTEALQTAKTFGPEIILCDLGLPDCSGLDVVRALRARQDLKRPLFVIHTALADSEIQTLERHVQFGDVDLFLSKPITDEKIDRLVHELQAVQRREETPERRHSRHAA